MKTKRGAAKRFKLKKNLIKRGSAFKSHILTKKRPRKIANLNAPKYVNDAKMSNEEMTRTLLHEINHAILNSGQYFDTNSDEPLVEWIARCYYSILFNQKIFKDYD